MKKVYLILVFALFCQVIVAQKYEFSTVIDLPTSSVKSQGNTGTCWSFSTTSFMESEIERISGKKIDLSEMYVVRATYDEKAWNYVMRQGKAQFSEGGLAHDWVNAVQLNGLVPQEAFTGLIDNKKKYDHENFDDELIKVLYKYIENDSTVTNWKSTTKIMLDDKIGPYISSFTYEGKNYTPNDFLKMTQLNPKKYVTLTSFTHKPFYSSFILDIPDNFSNGNFYNLPLDEYIQVIDEALKNGYTVELDIDVSEPTFSAKTGVAIIPKNKSDNKTGLKKIVDEMSISSNLRQVEFENFNTTDDHLMHITGIVKDQKGNQYYKVKNSWGTKNANGGFVYISKPYMQLKSISIMVHEDAIPQKTKTELHL